MRFIRDLKPALFAMAPNVAALAVAAAGVMLLASGATPSVPGRFIRLIAVAPVLLVEISHFLSSVMGLSLVLVAFGLRSRLDAAWGASVTALLIAAPLALLKAFALEEALILVTLAVLLTPLHGAFPRKARLTGMEITPGWLVSAAAALIGAGALGIWSFQHADYGDQAFWKVMVDDDAARAIRAWAGAATALFGFGVWRLIASAAPPGVVGESDGDYARVRAILATAEGAEPLANLALLGDKRFLFSASGESFLMFGVRGRSWIAMGQPVGRRDERLELLWRFRELADSHMARPAVYNLGPDALPDLVELGFSIQKVGEQAAVRLDTFSMDGSRKGNIRRAWRKMKEESGCVFEVLEGQAVLAAMDELAAVSDDWQCRQAGGEKGFTMGGFEPRYLAEFPVAAARFEGRIVAFANLWTTAERTAFSVDMMRHGNGAPSRIMDFLFVEIIEWGRSQGYDAFEFGMAPLAGLDDRPLAPLMSRVGRLLFERGEEIYNFQGLWKYKDKYDPVWQPRYIAALRKWAIPILMADVGLLSSGGMANLARRPRRTEEPESQRPNLADANP